ncbi:DUF6049 family protein [Oerskovia sp. M15]
MGRRPCPRGGRAVVGDAGAVSWATTLVDATVGRTVFALRPYDPDPVAYAQVGAKLPAATTPLPGGGTLDPSWRTDLTYPGDAVPDQATVATAVQAGSPLVVVRGGLAPADSVSYSPTGLATVETDSGDGTALVSDSALAGSSLAARPMTPPRTTARRSTPRSGSSRRQPSSPRSAPPRTATS